MHREAHLLHRYRLGWRAWLGVVPFVFWLLAYDITARSKGWAVLPALLLGRVAIGEIGWSALALATELMVTLVPLVFVAAHLQFPSVRRTKEGLSMERPFRRPQLVSWAELVHAEEVR